MRGVSPASPQTSQYLDFQVVNSDIEAERDHLRIGDHYVRLLTMRESITETRPLVLDKLLKIEANFYAVTEWTPLATDAAKKEVVQTAASRQYVEGRPHLFHEGREQGQSA